MDTEHVGGIEHQQALMARWLAREGYRVSMLTWDEGQGDGQTATGVTVYKMCRLDAGFRVLRFVHPRWTSLWRALTRANADIYYYNCGDLGLGQVALWCRLHKRKTVYSVASDPDCNPKLPTLGSQRERVLYRFGLRRADLVITQTMCQRDALRRGFRLDSLVIPMPCPDSGEDAYVAPTLPSTGHARVLWIGRISPEKRFGWLLDMAERCPEVAFDVVGAANTETGYARTLAKRAGSISNVVMHGRVPRSRMAQFYQRGTVLCCTSLFEGFPNTFLEAWSYGLPVVSTLDPDHLILTHGLGAVSYRVAGLVTDTRRLLQSPERWREASARARAYYLANHTLEVVMPRFEQAFMNVASPMIAGGRVCPIPNSSGVSVVQCGVEQ